MTGKTQIDIPDTITRQITSNQQNKHNAHSNFCMKKYHQKIQNKDIRIALIEQITEMLEN